MNQFKNEQWEADNVSSVREKAEEQLIAALLQNPAHQADLFSGFRPEYIDDKPLRKLYETALEIFKDGHQVTVLSLKEKFVENEGVAPPWLVPTIMQCDDSESNVVLPGFIPHIKSVIRKAYIFDKFKSGASQVSTVKDAERVSVETLDMMSEFKFEDEIPIEEEKARLDAKQAKIISGDMEWGYSFGVCERMDEIVLMVPGSLYIVGGIKKGAKTQFALSLIDHNLCQDPPVPVLFFSIEMSGEQVLKKLISRRTGINSRKILTKNITEFEFDDIKKAGRNICQTPLTVNQSPSLSTTEISSRARSWKYRNEIPNNSGIIVVDFLQLINNERRRGESEATILKNISYSLAEIAKSLKVVVVALAQLRNEAEGQKPHIRFLEGSGGIAQAAEAIILLDLIKRRKENVEEINHLSPIDIIIAAQRQGESGITIKSYIDLRTACLIERSCEE